jgi:hypothetical protein
VARSGGGQSVGAFGGTQRKVAFPIRRTALTTTLHWFPRLSYITDWSVRATSRDVGKVHRAKSLSGRPHVAFPMGLTLGYLDRRRH